MFAFIHKRAAQFSGLFRFRAAGFKAVLAVGVLLACASCALPFFATDAPLLEPTATEETPTPSPLPPSQTPTPSLTSSPSPSYTPLPPSETPTPGTPTDTPTITLTPTITRTPTVTPTPTPTRWVFNTWTPIPSRTPTITPTPTPPPAYLRILRPGAFSKLLSPVQVEASVSPGEDGLVVVELLGEDGRSLARQRLEYREYINRSIAISPRLEFRIAGVAELGRLAITVSDRFGRRVALASTDLLLFSIGENDFSPAGSGVAPYIFRSPLPDQVIQGGLLAVRGLIRPVNQNPVILELLDEQGQPLAATQLSIELPSGSLSHNPFEAGLAYKVSAPVRARLVLRQESNGRIPGTVALWSIPVNLEP